MSESYLAAVATRSTDAAWSSATTSGPKIWLVSDVHAEYEDNMSWLRELGRSSQFKEDVLILAGDVSADIGIMRDVLQALLPGFAAIFFTPGNHDLWTKSVKGVPMQRGGTSSPVSDTSRQHWSSQPLSRPGSPGSPTRMNSLEKLREIFDLCAELGVHAQPAYAAGALIVPILAWYHASWDTEPDVVGWDGIPAHDLVMKDFHMCLWPPPLKATDESVAKMLDGMNDIAKGGARRPLEDRVAALREAHPDAPLITFSHFVPRIELNPEKYARATSASPAARWQTPHSNLCMRVVGATCTTHRSPRRSARTICADVSHA